GFAVIQWLPTNWFTDVAGPYRLVFVLTLIPGIGAVVAFGLLVRERAHAARPELKFWASLRELPRPFYRLLAAVGLFGLGDFTDKLLILAAIKMLASSIGERDAMSFGVLLFAWRNVVQAVTAFPIGMASDRFGPRRPLIAGYSLGVLTMLGFAL